MSLIITCEHAGNMLPPEYNHLFSNDPEVLTTHRGWDPGAWDVALYLAHHFNVEAHGCFTTRLLIEANRSLHNNQLFSDYTYNLSEAEKQKLIQVIYMPYRTRAEHIIAHAPTPVIHLSIHTFTPVLNGEIRNVDIGLLYDPARTGETRFCDLLSHALTSELKSFSIRYNEPYKGTDDGFTTYLRTQHADELYQGIEIELNQKYIDTPEWQVMKTALAETIRQAYASFA